MSKLTDALCKFQKMNAKARKDGTNPAFKSSYATVDEVIEALQPASELGISYTQVYDYELKESNGVLHKIPFLKTTLYHQDDKDNEHIIESRYPMQVDEQARNKNHDFGSASTYARRYSLVSAFGLGLDDDGNASGNTKATNKPVNEKPKTEKSKIDISADVEKLREKLKKESLGDK
tara:strand:+ start:1640 stop:2170 length:531 start_codon:yes stop_codon:yes gene_type:complete